MKTPGGITGAVSKDISMRKKGVGITTRQGTPSCYPIVPQLIRRYRARGDVCLPGCSEVPRSPDGWARAFYCNKSPRVLLKEGAVLLNQMSRGPGSRAEGPRWS
ncbi:hypothetical protein AAFF_G00424340 [Aldrovandia affinis]|uniref:Uncharacterized protein n=1 Tax=Aldrovandia affinis TaxID=143900 RepID=A0AAD7X105_9TELE|nr:hypothetical protein AAFF_G00424340 [Aldrovandia affinis]